MAATDTNSSKGREDFILDNPTSMNTEQIKDIEPQSQDYWDSTVFYLDIHAEAKPPGSLADEQYLTADLTNPINNHNNNNHNNNTDSLITNNNNNSSNNVNNVSNDNNININININNNDNLYGYLRTNFPHWRRILSHDYMRNTDLHDPISPNLSANPAQLVLIHLDDHAWASVQHYLQASRVQHIPDLYHRFTLDSNDPLGRATAAEVVEFIKSQHSLEPIPAEALRRALLAKFVQNEDLARALVATGGAKLVSRSHDNAIVVEDALMWVRTVLRREHENTLKVLTSQKIGESKQEEMLRLMEGVFGKEIRALHTTATLPSKPVEKRSLEKDAVGYLEQIKTNYADSPKVFNDFLVIMGDFKTERINTPQVLDRVTRLFSGKPWLIRGFLMFLPPGHLLEEEDASGLVYVATPAGNKITIDTYQGIVKFDNSS